MENKKMKQHRFYALVKQNGYWLIRSEVNEKKQVNEGMAQIIYK